MRKPRYIIYYSLLFFIRKMNLAIENAFQIYVADGR